MMGGHNSTSSCCAAGGLSHVSQQENSKLGSQPVKAVSENILHSSKWKASIHTLKYFYYCPQCMQLSASVLSIQIQHAATGIYDLVQSQPPSEQACI